MPVCRFQHGKEEVRLCTIEIEKRGCIIFKKRKYSTRIELISGKLRRKKCDHSNGGRDLDDKYSALTMEITPRELNNAM
jgi:hypothetical protein